VSQVTEFTEKGNQEPIIEKVNSMELELSLSFFLMFIFNKYSEFLASLVICIYAIFGMCRVDFGQFLS
jgi:hypothetical protein